MKNKLDIIIERARKQILKATDPNFIHHKQYTKELPRKNVTGAQYQKIKKVKVGNHFQYEVIFLTNSATFPGEDEYHQKIILLDLNSLIKDTKLDMTLLDKVRYSINEGDIRLFCECPAHLYWGYQYICTKLKINHPRHKEHRKPKIRNPQLRGIICKHLSLVLTNIPFLSSTITSDIKKRLKPIRKKKKK